MNRRSYKLAAIFTFLSVATAALFFNCAQPNQIASSDTAASTKSNLTLVVTPTTISLGESAQAVASGGVTPYIYSMPTADGGTIDPNSGLIANQASAGTVVVEVEDSTGSVAQTSVVVTAGGTPEASCTVGSSQYPTGSTFTVYQASSVACGESCVSALATCSSGLIAGTKGYQYASCTTTSCQWAATATSCASPATTIPPSGSCSPMGTTVCVGTTHTTTVGYTTETSTTGAIYTCN